MHEWKVNPGNPFVLSLAADARLTHTDYINDQIWELAINRGDPPALSLDTTYGLRARKQRIFPRFREGDRQILDPADFFSPVTVQTYHPNYIKLFFYPLENLPSSLEYWIPDSHTAASRLTLKNTSTEFRQVTLSWIALLAPGQEGIRMAVHEIENVTVLNGICGDLSPVLFLGGGAYASSGPFPALEVILELGPEQDQSTVCILASLKNLNESFEHARKIAAIHWEAEITNLEMMNADRIQIITGEPDWDIVFELSQVIATSLLMSSTSYLPDLSFVQSRQPDHGFSLRGDGSDYNYLWNGQSVLEAWFLSQELLPKQLEIACGLIRNFISTQDEFGCIDCKPGLGNQRSSMNATPVLAQMVQSIYHQTQDKNFLESVFPALIKFYDSWFSIETDQDQDGLPEWKHYWQTGFDDHPIFSHWLPVSKGIEITTFECPDMVSWLYMEGNALMEMAELLGDLSSHLTLKARTDRLRRGILDSWDANQKIFHYWDRDTHLSSDTQVLYTGQIISDRMIQNSYPEPVRLLIQFARHGEATRRLIVFIHGTGPSGGHRVERISPEQIRWHMAYGFATSERVYTEVEKIIIEGNLPGDIVTVSTVGHKDLDLTLFLPLLTCIPTSEMTREMVKNILIDETLFWQPGGLPSYPKIRTYKNDQAMGDVNIIWNSLLIQALIKYDMHFEAAAVMTRIMNTLASSLHKNGEFRRLYRPETGEGKGEKNSLNGLAPLGSFLKLIGLEFLSPWRVFVHGSNPFSWPVTVKYYGTTVLRHKTKTTVVYPDGQTVSIDDESPHILALE